LEGEFGRNGLAFSQFGENFIVVGMYDGDFSLFLNMVLTKHIGEAICAFLTCIKLMLSLSKRNLRKKT